MPATPSFWQVYVHVPFCERKCHYCDFASWESPGLTQRRWLDTVLREISAAGAEDRRRARTVFFGGGTPSVLPPAHLQAILSALGEAFDLSAVEEMTLEANPSSLNREKVAAWRELGFGRVSLGVQSFDAEELRLLGRVHSPDSARAALEILAGERKLRFSGDLIFGLPGQTPERFRANLGSLLEYDPGHVSFYGLTVEKGTVFERWQKEGRLHLPEGEAYGEMYRQGAALLAERGLRRYEISNFAKAGQECRHNQGYWRDVPYRSFGPGAHSYDGSRRWKNPYDLEAYLRWGADGFPSEALEWDELDTEARLAEAVSLGLRQAEGVDLDCLQARFGIAWPEAVWTRWEKAGCLERSDGHARLLEDGWPLLDEIAAELLARARRAPQSETMSLGT